MTAPSPTSDASPAIMADEALRLTPPDARHRAGPTGPQLRSVSKVMRTSSERLPASSLSMTLAR